MDIHGTIVDNHGLAMDDHGFAVDDRWKTLALHGIAIHGQCHGLG